jgi:hypothetical protein
MGYTLYTQKLTQVSLLPAVAISRAGSISLNAAICRIFTKNGVKAVLLLSDLENRRIAMRPTTADEKWSYAVRFNTNRTQACVSGASFLKAMGWDGTKCKIDASWDEANSLVEFRMPDWGRCERGKLVPMPVKTHRAS